MKAAINSTHVEEEEGEQGHGHVDGVHGHHDLTAGDGCQIRFLFFFI